jgi:hypothetical protein
MSTSRISLISLAALALPLMTFTTAVAAASPAHAGRSVTGLQFADCNFQDHTCITEDECEAAYGVRCIHRADGMWVPPPGYNG